MVKKCFTKIMKKINFCYHDISKYFSVHLPIWLFSICTCISYLLLCNKLPSNTEAGNKHVLSHCSSGRNIGVAKLGPRLKESHRLQPCQSLPRAEIWISPTHATHWQVSVSRSCRGTGTSGPHHTLECFPHASFLLLCDWPNDRNDAQRGHRSPCHTFIIERYSSPHPHLMPANWIKSLHCELRTSNRSCFPLSTHSLLRREKGEVGERLLLFRQGQRGRAHHSPGPGSQGNILALLTPPLAHAW